jgi:hypothetical protein
MSDFSRPPLRDLGADRPVPQRESWRVSLAGWIAVVLLTLAVMWALS